MLCKFNLGDEQYVVLALIIRSDLILSVVKRQIAIPLKENKDDVME